MVKISGGKPKPISKWFKEDHELVPFNEKFEVIESEDVFTLKIKSAQSEDCGYYSAQLFNDAGLVNSNKAQLTVKFIPVFLNKPEDVISEVAQTVEFVILVKKTHMSLKLDCFKDDKLIKIDSVKSLLQINDIDSSYKLVLTNLVVQDAGRISFVASNMYGKSSTSAFLYIRC